MTVYTVSADKNGAFVDSRFTTENMPKQSYLAIFTVKIMAHDYVSYLNSTRAPEHLVRLLN